NGALEASNVNLSSELTSLINLQRSFEMQIKMMKKAEEMDESSDTLLRVV
ncbi:flagellar basal body rod C-terminal domain-containing protein, partial [Pseudoalteromonas sp. c7(2019)]